MKILIVGDYLIPLLHDEFKGSVTGSKIAIIEFTKALIKYGNFDELHFLISPDTEDYIFHNFNKLDKYINNINRIKITTFDNINKLKDIKFDVLHDFTLLNIEKLINLRNSFFSHNFPVTVNHHAISYYEFKNIFKTLMLNKINSLDSIICVSESAQKAIENIISFSINETFNQSGIKLDFKGNIANIPLGIDTEIFSKKDKLSSRNTLNLPSNYIIITYTGRFSRVDKANLEPLLLCIKRILINTDKDILFIFSGKDDNLKYSEKLKYICKYLGINNKVFIWTDIPVEKTNLLYQSSDIFISTSDSIQETFGLTILEAMSCGLPVLVSDWNGYKETVIEGKTGFKIKTYYNNQFPDFKYFGGIDRIIHEYQSKSTVIDMNEMYEKLIELINNESLIKEMGNNANIHVKENYSWEKIINEHEKLWKNLSENRKLSNTINIDNKKEIKSIYECFYHYSSNNIDLNKKVCKNNEYFSLIKQKDIINFLDSSYINVENINYILDNTNDPVIANKLKVPNNDNFLFDLAILLKYGFLEFV